MHLLITVFSSRIVINIKVSIKFSTFALEKKYWCCLALVTSLLYKTTVIFQVFNILK